MDTVGRGRGYIKAVGAVVVNELVRLFTPLRNRTGIPDIDDDHPLFDLPLPMIQHILSLTPHEREEFLERLFDGYIMGVHGELSTKGVPAVVEM